MIFPVFSEPPIPLFVMGHNGGGGGGVDAPPSALALWQHNVKELLSFPEPCP